MAMKENFISMAPDEESSAKVSLIDQNKTLMIDQCTSDVEAGNPEFVEDITNIDDALQHLLQLSTATGILQDVTQLAVLLDALADLHVRIDLLLGTREERTVLHQTALATLCLEVTDLTKLQGLLHCTAFSVGKGHAYLRLEVLEG